MGNELIPQLIEKNGSSIEITKKGALFHGDVPPSTVIQLMQKIVTAETACAFALGDLTEYLMKVKGKELLEIANATGISASDLKRRTKTCERLEYRLRRDNLHFDYHAEAAKSKSDDLAKFLVMATKEEMTRKRLKKSVELDREATDEDMKIVIEEHDEGTETFGTSINRIVILNGKLEREGNLSELEAEELFNLHIDFFPVVKIWAGFVKRFTGNLPSELEDKFATDLLELDV